MTRSGKLNSKANAGEEKSHAAVKVHVAQRVAAEARPAHSATNRASSCSRPIIWRVTPKSTQAVMSHARLDLTANVYAQSQESKIAELLASRWLRQGLRPTKGVQ